MIISSLTLVQFRNYPQVSFDFSPTTTAIVGGNAVGKTNVLEAIAMLSTSRSFRGVPDYEVIRWGEAVGHVEGAVVHADAQKIHLALAIGREQDAVRRQKRMTVNGVGRRIIDFLGQLSVIVFTPHDVELVTTSPSARRYHLDVFLALVDSSYKHAITQYYQHMRARNRLLETLREGGGHAPRRVHGKEELDYWDQQLAVQGTVMMESRQQLFAFLEKGEKPLGPFTFIYKPSVKGRSIAARLAETHDRDIAAGMTLSGPHRDDWAVLFDGYDLSHFGSRGEQRTAILTLKLLEVAYYEKIREERPVLLLDDIFSELDNSHRRHIFNVIGRQQTIITTTDQRLLQDMKAIKVISLPVP